MAACGGIGRGTTGAGGVGGTAGTAGVAAGCLFGLESCAAGVHRRASRAWPGQHGAPRASASSVSLGGPLSVRLAGPVVGLKVGCRSPRGARRLVRAAVAEPAPESQSVRLEAVSLRPEPRVADGAWTSSEPGVTDAERVPVCADQSIDARRERRGRRRGTSAARCEPQAGHAARWPAASAVRGRVARLRLRLLRRRLGNSTTTGRDWPGSVSRGCGREKSSSGATARSHRCSEMATPLATSATLSARTALTRTPRRLSEVSGRRWLAGKPPRRRAFTRDRARPPRRGSSLRPSPSRGRRPLRAGGQPPTSRSDARRRRSWP